MIMEVLKYIRIISRKGLKAGWIVLTYWGLISFLFYGFLNYD